MIREARHNSANSMIRTSATDRRNICRRWVAKHALLYVLHEAPGRSDMLTATMDDAAVVQIQFCLARLIASIRFTIANGMCQWLWASCAEVHHAVPECIVVAGLAVIETRQDADGEFVALPPD